MQPDNRHRPGGKRGRSVSAWAGALLAIALSSNVRAVCLDDQGMSGYHIPEAKELRDAHAIVIGAVVAERSAPPPSQDEYGGTEYRLRIQETLKGPKYKEIALFSENSSGRFPMVKGEKYLVYVSKERKYFWVSNCGNSGEAAERTELIGRIRELTRQEESGPGSWRVMEGEFPSVH